MMVACKSDLLDANPKAGKDKPQPDGGIAKHIEKEIVKYLRLHRNLAIDILIDAINQGKISLK